MVQLIETTYFTTIFLVVTGGSDGIGKNYARELAKRKINLVLISNVEEDLISVSKEIG